MAYTWPIQTSPRPESNGGLPIIGNPSFIVTSTSDTHVQPIMPFSWMTRSTNSIIASTSGENTIDYYVIAIYDANLRKLPFQYVTAAQANAAAYTLAVVPTVLSLYFEIAEDGLVTPITNANSGSGVPTWCDIIVAAVGTPDENFQYSDPFGTIAPNIMLNSDTVATSAGSLTCALHGLSPRVDQSAYNATAGSQRVFLASVRANT